MILKINNLCKSYGNKDVLKNVNLTLNDDEIISIVGKSGCGKSTLLNIIAGIDKDYSGDVNVYRELSYMLQDDALFLYMNNLDNALLGLKIKRKINDKSLILAKNYFNKYKILNYMYKKPQDMSGGMRQRLALIRTLMVNPDFILLDEALSKLDFFTKLQIENDIYSEIRDNKKSAIIVTHDIEEAVSMSDKVYLLKDGNLKRYDINRSWNNPEDARSNKDFRSYVKKILEAFHED